MPTSPTFGQKRKRRRKEGTGRSMGPAAAPGYDSLVAGLPFPRQQLPSPLTCSQGPCLWPARTAWLHSLLGMELREMPSLCEPVHLTCNQGENLTSLVCWGHTVVSYIVPTPGQVKSRALASTLSALTNGWNSKSISYNISPESSNGYVSFCFVGVLLLLVFSNGPQTPTL